MRRLLLALLGCLPLAASAAVTILGVPANRDLFSPAGGAAYTVEPGADAVVWAVSAKATGTALDITDIIVVGSTSGTATLSSGTVHLAKKQIANLTNDIVAVVYYVLAADLPVGNLTTSITWSGTLGSTQLQAKVYSLSATTPPIVLDTSSGVSQTVATDPFTATFTIVPNTTQIAVGGFTTSNINNIPGVGWTEDRDILATGSSGMRYVAQSKVSTTGGSIPWTFDLSAADTGAVAVASFGEGGGAAPVFTSAPVVTARNSSSITIGFTVNLTGSVAGVRVVDGSGPPTCIQIKAGQNAGGTAALQSWTEPVVANTADSHAFSPITNGTISDSYYCATASTVDGAIVAVADLFKTPAFTVAPSVTSAMPDGYVQSATCDGPGVLYTIAVGKNEATPTSIQVQVAQNAANGTPRASANKAVTGVDTITVTGLTLPKQNLHTICRYGGFNSAVTSLLNQVKGPPSGYQYSAPLASLGAPDSLCSKFNAIQPGTLQQPDIAVNDIIQISFVTSPSSKLITILNSCDTIFDSDGSRQTAQYEVYDDSTDSMMVGGPGTAWYNDKPPFIVGPPDESLSFFFPLGVQITPVDLSGNCDDPENDPIDIMALDPLPPNLFISGNVLQGPTTVRGKTRGIRIRCTDPAGAFVDW